MPRVRIGGHDVCFEDTGGGGPVLFLAHGYGLDRTMFDAQAELGSFCRVIAWDARGHGETPCDGGRFTYWDLARDQSALMNHLGVRQATIGGVSQGGFIALRTALIAPRRVTGLALFGTEAGGCHPADEASYRNVFAALSELGPVTDLVAPLAAQIIGDHAAAGLWVRRWQERGVPLGPAADCLLSRDNIVPRLGEIRCPALLVRGGRDVSIPAHRMAILRNCLPAATPIHVIADAGHSPPLTHPGETNTVLAKFRIQQFHDPTRSNREDTLNPDHR
jgi:pimeloyl-ACP methyl ester carboxylesterase